MKASQDRIKRTHSIYIYYHRFPNTMLMAYMQYFQYNRLKNNYTLSAQRSLKSQEINRYFKMGGFNLHINLLVINTKKIMIGKFTCKLKRSQNKKAQNKQYFNITVFKLSW